MDSFLKEHFLGADYKIISLAGDASNRRYFRIIKDQNSWVLMVWEPFDPNHYPFLSVLHHFAKNHIKVPQVEAMSPSEGLVLLEDLGDLTLERKFWESLNQENSLRYYQMAIDELVKIHGAATADRAPCTAFNIRFDTEKLLWEMNYGKENLLVGICKFQPPKEILDVFTHICNHLSNQPQHICHRDYHSRNLMIKLDEIRVIDFQDARLGPIQYDLVSLLCDSYVNMNDTIAEDLINYYLEKAKDFLPKKFSSEEFYLTYQIQIIQRCFKACGSFASFYIQRGDTRYLKYISHTLKRVMKGLALFPQYNIFQNVLIDSGALDRKYESP